MFGDLYQFGILIYKDEAVVEGALHDLFITLWKRKEFLNDVSSIKFYLRKSLKRNIVRKLEIKEKLAEVELITLESVYTPISLYNYLDKAS